MAHRPGWGDAECISSGDALICKTVKPGFPIWPRPTRPKATETPTESRIPAFTRRVRQDSAT
jgi:hypothetical protein